ncbi:MAG TPA: aminotransferase class III-fold pyridoxal phosphate-dependent enzyme [Acidimicrobiia bacterium]|nr:aminotransferase class III-fold pyridoxal phosphate-dependent enzyme [Acidimicrobiia bacterium]
MSNDLEGRVAAARRAFADRNPGSRLYFEQARRVLPGGHTRTVLTHLPFPLTFTKGEKAMLTDVDGHTYRDFLGDYTAGLFGHSEHRIREAADRALRENASVGGIHAGEEVLARLMCQRFGLDRVRFTNSGTEANLMAITTALTATGRRRLLVCSGAYHGGLLYFIHGSAPWNAPYNFLLTPYNDLAAAVASIEEAGTELAAVLLEPMLGAAGCIPATAAFLSGVSEAARGVGAVVIFDEVMTSRQGPRGMAALLGVEPDLRTFGKYLGGGFSFGAFGGQAELMDLYDQTAPGGPTIAHAGTFNNNLASITAGRVVLEEIFTAEIAEEHRLRGDRFRQAVEGVVAESRGPLTVTGFGSMMSLHALSPAPTNGEEAEVHDGLLQELIFLELLQRGIYIAPRGMINLSLAHEAADLEAFLEALADCLASSLVFGA